jgi:DNA-binding Lrp family transcriptional regulator
LTYAEIAERLNCSTEAVRALARRHRWPKLKGNDGRARVTVDLADVNHTPLPARSPSGDQVVTTPALAELQTKIDTLNAEVARLETTGAGHRADFERERDRAEQLMAELLKATAEAMAAKEAAARLDGELVVSEEAVTQLDVELGATTTTAPGVEAEPATLRSRPWWRRLAG